MKSFIVTIALPRPDGITNEFVNLIPEQRSHIDTLMKNGVVTDYALAADRSTLWAIIKADSSREVYEILELFPLRKFMEPAVLELMFHHSMVTHFPAFSLN